MSRIKEISKEDLKMKEDIQKKVEESDNQVKDITKKL